MFKTLIRKMVPSESLERFFSLYSMFFKNTHPKYYREHGRHTQLVGPISSCPQFVEMEDYTRLQAGTRIISSGGIVRIKKYTAVGADCTFVPGSHVPTVGLPQFLSITHINDHQSTITLGEDVWVGTRCTFLEKAQVGRGAVIGACSLVNKAIPPYAVVVGAPARVIAVRFTKEQILKHEAILYPPEERMKPEELDELFETVFKDMRSIGVDTLSEEDHVRLNQAKAQYEIPDYENC